ncbi:MAG: hypothetical protein O7G83_01080, partial [Proteobacteria bacterium]|nr:hypothetical protein [Pseudomonadota bacterium]
MHNHPLTEGDVCEVVISIVAAVVRQLDRERQRVGVRENEYQLCADDVDINIFRLSLIDVVENQVMLSGRTELLEPD